MLNDEQKALDIETFLNKQVEPINEKPKKPKLRYFIISILICLVVIATTYLISNKSNVVDITVDGNVYLDDVFIVAISNIDTSSKYIFVRPSEVENSILTNPLIDTCTVTKNEDQTISVDVKEKKIIGYCYENNQNVLVLSDNSRIELNKDNLFLIENAPLLVGFNTDQILLIEKNLNDIDYRMINEVSEIHFYPELKFQDHKVIMRDGNNIFTSVYGLKLLDKYYDMAAYDSDGYRCFFIEDISGNAYASACPWQASEEVVQGDNQEKPEE